MSNGWVDINQYNGPAQAYQNEQSFGWHPGPATPPINPKTGQPYAALPGVPGHYITGDYEATLRNQGFTPAQAAVLSALNTWRWKQLGAQQGAPAAAAPNGASIGPAAGTAPAESLASRPALPIGGPVNFRSLPPSRHSPVYQTPPINPQRRHLLNILG